MKALVLDMDSRQVELSSCHTCLDCKLISRMKKEVKIFISVLDQDMEVITIRISEDTTAETVIKMVLQCPACPAPSACVSSDTPGCCSYCYQASG